MESEHRNLPRAQFSEAFHKILKTPIHNPRLRMNNCSWQIHTEPRLMHKAKWSPTEDEQLKQAILEFGTDSWNKVGSRVPTRSGKQCRERWIGQLAPSVSKDIWLPEEDIALVRAQAVHGNKWTLIAAQMPGRSALSVKNRWNWLIRHSAFGRLFQFPPPRAIQPEYPPDVIERRRPSSRLLEPLVLNDGLFGSRFQEFQAKMFMQ
jgi:hypothetical protein